MGGGKHKEAGKVHDWRNYVHDEWIKNWGHMSKESRTIIAIMAEERASAEEWD